LHFLWNIHHHTKLHKRILSGAIVAHTLEDSVTAMLVLMRMVNYKIQRWGALEYHDVYIKFS